MPMYDTGKRDAAGNRIYINAPSVNRYIVAYEKQKIPAAIAWRIECGASISQAALAEYLYRVKLSTQSWRCFGAPCLLGQ